jgi:ubiquinol-cytochrome c reductase iron-sulfur subunit
LLLGRGRRRRALPPPERLVEPGPSAPRVELAVAGLLLLAAGLAVAFVVVYAGEADTQLLGLALGLCLAALAAACVLAAFRLVPGGAEEELYPEPAHGEEQAAVVQIVGESGGHLTRRRLLVVAAGGAGAALGAALLTPLVSLGPVLDASRLRSDPWRGGVRLVDGEGRPLRADEIEPDTLHTAFPEGADPDELGSPIVVVRLEPTRLELPPERGSWAPEGIVAYSKICTHAGCAIGVYRTPLFGRFSPRPALVCPCHYSTFDPATGGSVLFGPAGRPLPQLPLSVGSGGELRARGGLSGPVGPSWSGVRS